MNVVWQRSFEFSFSVERVFSGYLEMQGTTEPPPVGTTFTLPDPVGTRIEITESRANERLAWAEHQGESRADMTMAFESTETGSRITITRYGFGEGDEFEIFRQSHQLGNAESMQDLAVYLSTGVKRRRHLVGDRSATGIALLETEAGLEVVSVRDGGLGAETGLEPGDLLLSIDGAALYSRTDLWLLTRLFDPGRDVEIGYVRSGELCSGRGRMAPLELATVGELGLGPRVDA